MSITVKDVAREAGVSRTTVSNVFSGRAKFSEETRAAVLAAAEKLGYRPNLAARSLITHQTGLIGLILPPYVNTNTLANNPFYNIILDSIYAVLQDEAYYDLLILSAAQQNTDGQVRDRINTRSVDGLLAIGEFDQDFLRFLQSRDLPAVLIDNYAPQQYAHFSYVNSDDETGGYLATRQLIARGFRQIGLCTLDIASPLMQKRIAGCQRAMREAGLALRVLDQIGAPFEVGQRFADLLLEQQLDAAFCAEDMLAIGVLHRLLQRGISVGQQFGLVGFDNIRLSSQVYPELTTIDQRIYEKGEAATRALLAMLKDKKAPGSRLVLPVHLVTRQTA